MLKDSNRAVAAPFLLCLVSVWVGLSAAEPRHQRVVSRHRISGRVIDSHGQVPLGGELTVLKEEGDNS